MQNIHLSSIFTIVPISFVLIIAIISINSVSSYSIGYNNASTITLYNSTLTVPAICNEDTEECLPHLYTTIPINQTQITNMSSSQFINFKDSIIKNFDDYLEQSLKIVKTSKGEPIKPRSSCDTLPSPGCHGISRPDKDDRQTDLYSYDISKNITEPFEEPLGNNVSTVTQYNSTLTVPAICNEDTEECLPHLYTTIPINQTQITNMSDIELAEFKNTYVKEFEDYLNQRFDMIKANYLYSAKPYPGMRPHHGCASLPPPGCYGQDIPHKPGDPIPFPLSNYSKSMTKNENTSTNKTNFKYLGCPSNTEYNSILGRCVVIPSCPDGYGYNPFWNGCDPIGSPQP